MALLDQWILFAKRFAQLELGQDFIAMTEDTTTRCSTEGSFKKEETKTRKRARQAKENSTRGAEEKKGSQDPEARAADGISFFLKTAKKKHDRNGNRTCTRLVTNPGSNQPSNRPVCRREIDFNSNQLIKKGRNFRKSA